MVTYEVSEGESVSVAVISALAAFEDVDTTDLPPLYEVIEPDALDALYKRSNGQEAFSGVISFEFNNATVEVNGGSDLTVSVSSKTYSRRERPQETP